MNDASSGALTTDDFSYQRRPHEADDVQSYRVYNDTIVQNTHDYRSGFLGAPEMFDVNNNVRNRPDWEGYNQFLIDRNNISVSDLSTSTMHNHIVYETVLHGDQEQEENVSTPLQHKQSWKEARNSGYQEGPVSWWWWWEILAMVLCIGCMVALIVMLCRIDNTPLADWRLPIQPNTVIAVLTTLAKANLLVSLAACTSQLKWRHFELNERKLVDIQTFDDASRGPWGSIMLLAKICLRARARLAAALALVAIATLGIEACAQQVLEFPVQETELHNVTVQMGIATNYTSKAFERPWTMRSGASTAFEPSVDTFAFQSSVSNAAAVGKNTPFQPYFSCPQPATRCTVPEFKILALCMDTEMITDIINASCSYEPKPVFPELHCNYSLPNWSPSTAIQMNDTGPSFNSVFRRTGISGSWEFVAVNMTDYWDEKSTTLPIDVYRANFTWCEKTVNNTELSATSIQEGSSSSEKLFYHTGEWNARTNTYTTASNQTVYNVSAATEIYLGMYLSQALSNSEYVLQTTYLGQGNVNFGAGFGTALSRQHPFDVLNNVVSAINGQIRSSTSGDNWDAEVIAGTAYFKETFIYVRWPWIVLPLTETVLGALILVITVLLTRNGPVLKSSAIAYFRTGFGLWPEDRAVFQPLTIGKLEEGAKCMNVQLKEDRVGNLAFTRIGSG
ncbi:hypothetical protein TruAng_004840 [Truncatella angustata]|nr:hypothetical protein TruAng_004840 [Truncatella angustata]